MATACHDSHVAERACELGEGKLSEYIEKKRAFVIKDYFCKRGSKSGPVYTNLLLDGGPLQGNREIK